MVEIMELIVALVDIEEFREKLVVCLREERLQLLARWITEIEQTINTTDGCIFPVTFIQDFYKFIRFIFVKDILDYEKQVN